MLKKIRDIINNSLKNQKGFTLIELLVVVVILGILAAVVIPKVTDSSKEAKNAADKANISTLETAAERYYLDKGDYPDNVNDLVYYVRSIPKTPDGRDYSINKDTGKVTGD